MLYLCCTKLGITLVNPLFIGYCKAIYDKPVVSITGPSTTCVGINTAVSPTTGGTWVSNMPLIASITDAGVVTPLSQEQSLSHLLIQQQDVLIRHCR
ncbi:MAG: hypothetical protein IPO92_11540 [Saprospiraceae bacterium]|nr:hypothetical protein [Saprospiraceae bacterium]